MVGSRLQKSSGSVSFFDYLAKENLKYDTQTVENFLLSIKAKQFLILSGPSGTGKTKIAQAYGQYISKTEGKPIAIELGTVVDKADSREGTLSLQKKNVLFDALPKEIADAEKEYYFTLGNVRAKGKLSLTPRLLSITENKEELKAEIKRLRETIPDDPDNPKKKKNAKLLFEMPTPADYPDKCYVVVPVGPNWNEKRFILGYKNPITKEYVSNPCYDILCSAAANKDVTHLLILDEMNISHVERYFADILSAMESHESIELDDDTHTKLSIDENLVIVGTVNQDETTYTFSPKVLDRANVIEFKSASIDDAFSLTSDNDKPTGDIEFLEDVNNYTLIRRKTTPEIIRELNSVEGNESVTQEIKRSLSTIQSLLDKIGFSFGYRTIDELMRFMYAAWHYERKGTFDNWKRYFDAQILQKILPKLHGNLSIRPTLTELKNFCDTNKYPKATKKLQHMIDVLDAQRYVSFNC